MFFNDEITLKDVASRERIASEARRTTANGIVIDHLAIGVSAASADARIQTLVVQAGLGQRALGTHRALRPTGRWYAHEVCATRANRVLGNHATDAVRSTRRWSAWVLWYSYIKNKQN